MEEASQDQDHTSRLKGAGRGGLALMGGKVYFLVTGLVQQIALKQVLGLGGYGAFSTASAVGSICYNPLVQAGIQGVSRETAAVEQAQPLLRRLLNFHAAFSLVFAVSFFAAAGPTTAALGAPHVAGAVRALSLVLLIYGVYATMVGFLNGRHRFLAQAGLDVLSATLRTLGLILGGVLSARFYSRGDADSVHVDPVTGAMMGFACAALFVTLLAARLTGWGKAGDREFSPLRYAQVIAPIWAGQLLLNVLFQADGLLLRRFAALAATADGLSLTAADPYVGAYRASQLFCFLPFQLLSSITFVLFPLLARARAEGDQAQVRFLITRGLRIALLVAGGIVSVVVAVPEGLLTLVFQEETAQLAGESMRVLGVGMGFFALLGVCSSALNSLGAERRSLVLILLAVSFVVTLCLAFGRGHELSPSLLTRIAAATSLAMILTTCVAFLMLRQVSGALPPLSTLGRTLIAGSVSGVLISFFLPPGHLNTVLGSLLTALLYLVALIVMKELSARDLRQLLTLLRR